MANVATLPFHPQLLKKRRKPTCEVIPNRDNYFGWHLRHAYIFQNGRYCIDSAGDRHGTISGASIVPRGGNLYFENDASDDRIILPNVRKADFLSFSGGEVTVACRVNYLGDDAGPHPFPYIYGKQDGGNSQNGHALLREPTTPDWRFIVDRDLATANAASSLGGFNSGWGNVAGVVSVTDDQTKCYATGGTFGTAAMSGAPVESDVTTPMAIGNWAHSTDREWQGEIEYLFFFDDSFTQDQIDELWDDPYQVFRPKVPALYIIPTTAAGSTVNITKASNTLTARSLGITTAVRADKGTITLTARTLTVTGTQAVSSGLSLVSDLTQDLTSDLTQDLVS